MFNSDMIKNCAPTLRDCGLRFYWIYDRFYTMRDLYLFYNIMRVPTD